MEPEIIEYIRSLDAEKDAEILREKLSFSEAVLDNLKIMTMLLKVNFVLRCVPDPF